MFCLFYIQSNKILLKKKTFKNIFFKAKVLVLEIQFEPPLLKGDLSQVYLKLAWRFLRRWKCENILKTTTDTCSRQISIRNNFGLKDFHRKERHALTCCRPSSTWALRSGPAPECLFHTPHTHTPRVESGRVGRWGVYTGYTRTVCACPEMVGCWSSTDTEENSTKIRSMLSRIHLCYKLNVSAPNHFFFFQKRNNWPTTDHTKRSVNFPIPNKFSHGNKQNQAKK